MEKVIKLHGKIDSANAAETEKNILNEIGDFTEDLTIDAKDLKYISSAGLRIILRLKKMNDTTRVINCSPEVYDIFDMTGFSEMMDVSKAFRELSVDGCEVIGEGANGIVYRTDPDTIVKVYKNPESLDIIKRERELARKAFVMGIPTAIPYDVVKVGDLYGSVFELLSAASFAKLIGGGADPAELAKESVEILKKMHSTFLPAGDLPDKKEEALGWAKEAEGFLPGDLGKKLVSMFEEIPVTNNILHGDFHIKNIMKQGDENLLIDMDTLSQGHPVFEFAAIFAAYEGFGCVDENNPSEFLGISKEACKIFLDTTFETYFEEKSKEEIEDIRRMAAIICYTRIYRRTTSLYTSDPEYAPMGEFCLKYLEENVPKLDRLYFDV